MKLFMVDSLQFIVDRNQNEPEAKQARIQGPGTVAGCGAAKKKTARTV
jgi:hypothetical protein